MDLKIKCKVVMLPTNNNKEGVFTMSLMNIILKDSSHPENNQYQNRDIYIISDDEINEDDYFINLHNNTINKAYNWIYVSNCKKIIATTDKELKIDYDGTTSITKDWGGKPLPQLAKSFINKYIQSYNNGNIIEEVLVEYENIVEDVYGDCHLQTINDGEKYLETCKLISSNIKINNKENSITITNVKNSWNRDEVIELLNNYEKDNLYYGRNPYYNNVDIAKEWIKENL